MLKKMKKVLSMVLCAMLVVTALPFTADAAAVKISKKSATVYAGKTLQLKVLNTKKSVKWSTSNKKVATVSSKGLVKGVKEGKATITAKVGKKKYTSKITVKARLNATKATLTVGGSTQLKMYGVSKVTWSTSNKSVATVTSKGKVTAKKAGSATITAKVGKKKYTCKVTVKAKLNATSKTLKEGENYQLKLTGAAGKVAWTSSNASVAAVSSTGKVTAKKAGVATITVKDGATKYTCTITVKAVAKPEPKPEPKPDNPGPENPNPENPGQETTVPDYENMDYTAPITGVAYNFIFKPVAEQNKVVWDAEKGAFHLINKETQAENTRAFLMDSTYLTNLMAKTKAEIISYEFMWDGTQNWEPKEGEDLGVYTSFYDSEGNWYVEGQFNRTALSGATDTWVTVTINLADIPKNADESIQAPFLMNTIGGLYVRNVKVTMEKDYNEAISGENYTSFIKPLSDTNKVTWDATQNAFHLENKVTASDDSRGFCFDTKYIEKLVEKVRAEYITYEFKVDGIPSGNTSGDGSVYYGFYPNWWDTREAVAASDVTDAWKTVKIKVTDLPKDEEGNAKSPFLMNPVSGLYVRNITVIKEAGNGNYLSPIQGNDFTFFIEPISDQNKVTWDEGKNAFHLENKVTAGDDSRAFLFDTDYIEKIIAKTNAESISYEFMWDGNESGAGGDDRTIYTSFYPNWWDQTARKGTGISTEMWTTVTIDLANMPKDENDKILAPFIMNTVGGIYVRNITIKEKPAKVLMDIRADQNQTEMRNLVLRFYNSDTTGGIGDVTNYKDVEITAKNTTSQTVEMDLDFFLNTEGKFAGFSFVSLGYDDYTTDQGYDVYISNIRIEKDGETIPVEMTAENCSFTAGTNTGITGGHGNPDVIMVTSDGKLFVYKMWLYATYKATFTTPMAF